MNNELTQYAKERIKEFNVCKPGAYDESLYRKIKNIKDIEDLFKIAEEIIHHSEKEENAGYLPDNEERNLAIFNTYTALRKASDFIGGLALINDSDLESISKEQFDTWCDKLHDLITRFVEQNSRYVSRGDMWR